MCLIGHRERPVSSCGGPTVVGLRGVCCWGHRGSYREIKNAVVAIVRFDAPVPAARMSSHATSFTFDRLLAALVFLAIVVACGLTPMQTDTWWQLRAGRDMWLSRSVLLTDVYSHTAYGSFWPNHEWLAEAVFYGLFRLGGFPLLTLFATALIASGWIVTWQLAKGPVRERFIWVGLALIPSSLWWEPRPHAFSLLFIPTTVALLARDRLWYLPPLFLIWANCHGGVLLGFLLLGAGLFVRTVLLPKTWRQAVLVFLACMVATTATPLGFSFWSEIPKSLARVHLYPLDEWRHPRLMDLRMLPLWITVAAFCVGLVRNRRRLRGLPPDEGVLYACALVLLPMALTAIRNVGPFLMIAAPALTSLIRIRRQPEGAGQVERPLLNMAVMITAALAVAITLAWAYVNQIPRLRWAPVPAGALEALRRCPDNLYNRYDEGGYLLWFAPERRVFLDGRQDPFPPSLVLEHIRMETGGGDFRAVFLRHGIHCAYLPTQSPTAVQLMTAGWTTLYRDTSWIVLGDILRD
jgi:hypothetical protein